jgi:23S rRNA pseudouridine2604 synthase
MDKSLNKYISETGFCSRREADKYIEQGRVTINENVAIKGNRVMPGDIVEVDGEPIKKKDKIVYIVFNKPVGITCTTDLKDKHNIISFINYKSRIFPIGRLDKPSEGLIFLTNDGDIVNKILRAGNNHEKEYLVTVDKPITGDFVNKMSNGIRILDTITKKCFVKQEGKDRFRIILTQGLNRQIRRMCLALGYNVTTLKRVRIMNMTLANLPVGKWRYFTPGEIATVENLVAGSSKTATGPDFNVNDMQE